MRIATSVPAVQRDVEGQAGILPAEQPRRERQVRGAADGQKFGERLNDREDDNLVKGHELAIVASHPCRGGSPTVEIVYAVASLPRN